MGQPAAESAQQGVTQRCAILGNRGDMAGGKEAQRVLGTLEACPKTKSISMWTLTEPLRSELGRSWIGVLESMCLGLVIIDYSK